MPFKKGQSGNLKGRPKDKTWATLQYWFDKLNADLNNPNLEISDKVKAELKCIELILAKRSLPSESAEESVSNAKDALELLRNLEENALHEPDTKESGNPNSMADGQPKI